MKRKQIYITFEDDWVWAYPVDDDWMGNEFDDRYPTGLVEHDSNTWVGILESTWQSDNLVPGLGVADKDILSIEIRDL